MTERPFVRSVGRGLVYGAGLAAATCAAYVGIRWLRYGHVQRRTGDSQDPVLDRFMPTYEIDERHHMRIAAPAEVTFAAACEVDLQQSAIVRGIFRSRELILSSAPDVTEPPRGLLAWAKTLGWGVLAEVPRQEVVVGGVTRPWDANVVFRALPPASFAAFPEPDYVKIVWTLRVEPRGPDASIARHETRAVATDASARRKFRMYWSLFSPGIVLIRRVALRLIRTEAERRARANEGPPAVDRFELVSAGNLDSEC